MKTMQKTPAAAATVRKGENMMPLGSQAPCRAAFIVARTCRPTWHVSPDVLDGQRGVRQHV